MNTEKIKIFLIIKRCANLANQVANNAQFFDKLLIIVYL